MKLLFILNPRSGYNRRRPRLASEIERFISTRRLDASLVITDYPGHATELARHAVAQRIDRVVAIGGDGTMNEVAQSLVHSPCALALVPCGSGNGLARHLRLPGRLTAALELAVSPHARVVAIDTGSANGHAFFNAMGLGLDAEVSLRFNQLTRRGIVAYVRTGFAAFVRRRTQAVVIRSGDQAIPLDVLLVAIANSDQYGNNARIAPGARVDDGELDLVALRSFGFLGALPLVWRLFAGSLPDSNRALHLRSASFEIERPHAGLIHTDGETHHTRRIVRVDVHPRSLRVVAPASRHAATPVISTPSTEELRRSLTAAVAP